MAPLDSASDLAGLDLGSGDVRLTWSYPVDIIANSIVFDVYGGTDAIDPLRTAYATGVAALTIDLHGFGFAGDRVFTVVARRGDLLSLPARMIVLHVAPPPSQVTIVGGAGASGPPPDSGVGFPFGVTPAGSIFAQSNDDLLRSKILQLLLTVPGERVCLPDYGTRLMDLVFDPNSDVLAATTQFMVARALQQYLGDEIQIDQVQITADDNVMNVDVSYLKKTDLRAEMVRIGIPLPSSQVTS